MSKTPKVRMRSFMDSLSKNNRLEHDGVDQYLSMLIKNGYKQFAAALEKDIQTKHLVSISKTEITTLVRRQHIDPREAKGIFDAFEETIKALTDQSKTLG